ncbi:hypothetical protein HDV03_003645 [Kappamyces sp. JEL0829]|nr:hypothetical protein HDV03_003645 [Kappamyces sp. JEL0829]
MRRDRDSFGRDERRGYDNSERSRDYSPGRDSRRDRDGYGREEQREQHLMDYREFVNYTKDRAGRGSKKSSLDLDEQEIAKRYEIYRQGFINTLNEKFFKIHSGEEWFREKYHPEENQAFKTQVLERKREMLQEFQSDLSAGKLDRVCFDEVEAAPGEGEDTDQLYGVSLKENATSKPYTMFLTGVGMEVKRAALTEVGDAVLNVLEPGKGITTSTRSLTGHASKPSRLVHDLNQAKELAQFLDSEAEFPPGSGLEHITHYCEKLLSTLPDTTVQEPSADVDMEDTQAEESLEPKPVDKKTVDPADLGINVGRVKKELDLVLLYLHTVHFYDYYSGIESSSPEDHCRRGHISLRKPFEKVQDNNVPYWLAKLSVSSRIAPVPVQDAEIQTNKELSLYIRKEDETKFRCTECQKLFRGDDFVRKHIKTKHPHLVAHIAGDVEFFNFFSSRAKLENNKSSSLHRDRESFGGRLGPRDRDYRRESGRGQWDRDSGTGGRPSRYNDWDAVKQEKIVLNYD